MNQGHTITVWVQVSFWFQDYDDDDDNVESIQSAKAKKK